MYDDFISFLQYPGYAYGDKHKQALVVKALPKNTGDVKPKSAPTVRAARKTLGAGGRVRYTYANERGGVKPKKAVGSASVANNTQVGVTPTEQKADPAKFCELLGIRRDVLMHVVKRSKTQDDFVNYMLLNLKKLNTKYTLTGDFYRRLYDQLGVVQKALNAGYMKHKGYIRVVNGKAQYIKGGKPEEVNVSKPKIGLRNTEPVIYAAHKHIVSVGKKHTEESLHNTLRDYVERNFDGLDAKKELMVKKLLEALHRHGLVSSIRMREVTKKPKKQGGVDFAQHIRVLHDMPEITKALDYINYVHGNGSLPKIKIKYNEGESYSITIARSFGVYLPDTDTILLAKKRPDGAHMSVETALHELGHSVDAGLNDIFPEMRSIDDGFRYEMIHTKKWAESSIKEPTVRAIRDALVASKRFKDLTNAYYALSGNKQKSVCYLLAPKELFARAYSQYILTKCQQAQRSGHKFLDNADFLYKEAILGKYSQWTVDDFKPIEKALDAFFKQKGWLRINAA